MTRAALFEAIRPFAPDLRFSAPMVQAIDALGDLLGLPRTPGGEVPVPAPISFVDGSLLGMACPSLPADVRDETAAAIRKACVEFDINNVRRVSAFLAQLSVESGFKPSEEALSYSAQRMAEVWPGRFSVTGKAGGHPNALAQSLEHKPEAFANVVYANRLGNGPPESGDGWKFRGEGLIQLTGLSNWTRFAASRRMSVDEALAYARTLEGGVISAAWFWEDNDINRLADTPGVTDESVKVNGGQTGLADRKRVFDLVVAELLKRGA